MGFPLGGWPAARAVLAPRSTTGTGPCEKHGHKSEGAAWAHVRAELRSGRVKPEDVPRLNAYLCPRGCGQWHVGRKQEGRAR